MSPFESLTPSTSMSSQPLTSEEQDLLTTQKIAAVMVEMRETCTEPVWLGACHVSVLKEQFAKKSSTQLSTRSDQVFDQTEASSESRSKQICSSDYTHSPGDNTKICLGEPNAGGTDDNFTTPTSQN